VLRQSVATWSAIRGLRVRMRAIAPWALHAGLRRLAEAEVAAGQDATTVSRKIEVMSRNRLWREALLARTSAPVNRPHTVDRVWFTTCGVISVYL
jgi:hypothetical protein